MVIQQFNKLIRNKWVWGAFAIVISAAFCFDDLFTTRQREERNQGEAGLLGAEVVSAKEFSQIADDIRGFGRNRDWRRNAGEVNREAWEMLAELAVARANGVEATASEIQNAIRNDSSFQVGGKFSFALYQRLLRENSVTPEQFEEYLKRNLTVRKLEGALADASTWVSPMEIDRAVTDRTDVYTVKVASFKLEDTSAKRKDVDDEELLKWYNANTNSLALPTRVKLRMVKFDATDEEVQKKMVVTEDEMRDMYDATIDKYTTTGTNGVETVKKFEEVKDEIEKSLRQLAAVQYFETNLNFKAYAVKSAKGASRLDEIAKEYGLKVTISDYFTVDGAYAEGFMERASAICPGAKGFEEAVAALEPTSEDLRYGVVSSDKAVWLIEVASVAKAGIPSFEAAKSAIYPRALKDAKAEAFKAAVNEIAAKGKDEVIDSDNVTTNITFAICDLKQNDFDNQWAVAGAVRKLAKGEVSEFVRTGADTGILVVCEDRVPGDAAKAILLKAQVREELSMLPKNLNSQNWKKLNLERIGFTPSDSASVEIVEAAE